MVDRQFVYWIIVLQDSINLEFGKETMVCKAVEWCLPRVELDLPHCFSSKSSESSKVSMFSGQNWALDAFGCWNGVAKPLKKLCGTWQIAQCVICSPCCWPLLMHRIGFAFCHFMQTKPVEVTCKGKMAGFLLKFRSGKLWTLSSSSPLCRIRCSEVLQSRGFWEPVWAWCNLCFQWGLHVASLQLPPSLPKPS